MKKSFLFFNLFFLVFLIACSPNKVEQKDIENISFTVDKTQLSQSYQLKDPHAEFVSKGEDLQTKKRLKLLVSLGAMESSGLEIKEITKSDTKLSIYVNSIYEKDKLQLAVPQAMLTLDRSLFDKPLDSYSFEIINDNGRPLEIKLDMNDAISKVESYFKIAGNVSPDAHLIKEDDVLIWSIKYIATFDKAEENLPLVSFSTKINANDGSIVESEKNLISNPIDNGHILNIETDNYILYKKCLKPSSNTGKKEELWVYNLNNDKKELIFTSDYVINSTQFSPNLSFISVIEANNGNSSLYLIPKSTRKAYKVALEDGFSPNHGLWKDNNKIILLEKMDDGTRICKYDAIKEEQDGIIQVKNIIDGMAYEHDTYIFTEDMDKGFNKKIYATKDFESMDLISHGFQPELLNERTMIFLEDEDQRDTNNLIIYDLEKREPIHSIEGYIQNFQVLADNYIVYIEKEENHNNYILYGLSLNNLDKIRSDHMQADMISKSISDRVFYNKNYNLFFLNVNIPFEYKHNEMIYLIDSIKQIN